MNYNILVYTENRTVLQYMYNIFGLAYFTDSNQFGDGLSNDFFFCYCNTHAYILLQSYCNRLVDGGNLRGKHKAKTAHTHTHTRARARVKHTIATGKSIWPNSPLSP